MKALRISNIDGDSGNFLNVTGTAVTSAMLANVRLAPSSNAGNVVVVVVAVAFTGTASLAELDLSNVDAVAASFTVDIEVGTTDIYCSNDKAYRLVAVGATAIVRVFGDVDELNSSGSQVTSGDLLYSRTLH